MKLLSVLANLGGHGGAERVTCELANTFAETGDEIEILSPFGYSDAYFSLSSVTRTTTLSTPEVDGKLGRFAKNSLAILKYYCFSRPDWSVWLTLYSFFFMHLGAGARPAF